MLLEGICTVAVQCIARIVHDSCVELSCVASRRESLVECKLHIVCADVQPARGWYVAAFAKTLTRTLESKLWRYVVSQIELFGSVPDCAEV